MLRLFDKYYRLVGVFLILVILAGGGGIVYKEQRLKNEEQKVPQIESLESESPYSKSSSPNHISSKININTASQKELEELPGIGPAKAKAIIAYRKKNGNFRLKRDIIKVKGIGEKTYEKIKNLIEVN